MSLPSLPKRQKFSNPDKHVAKKELHKKIRRAIQDLFKRMYNREPIVAEEVLCFAGFINPGNNPDVSRLPTVAKKITSPRANKAICLYHQLSWLIQLYWKWLQKESPETEQEIHNIITFLNGLDYFNVKIVGDDREGYALE